MEQNKLEKKYRKYIRELEQIKFADIDFYYDVELAYALSDLDQAKYFLTKFQNQLTGKIRLQRILNTLSGNVLTAFENPFWKDVTMTEIERLDQALRTLQPLFHYIQSLSEEDISFERTSPIVASAKFLFSFAQEEAQFYEAKTIEADFASRGIDCHMNVPDPIYYLAFFDEKIGKLVDEKNQRSKKERSGKCLEKKL